MRTESWHLGSFSPTTVVAALSILALIVAITWQSTSSWRNIKVVDVAPVRVSIGRTGTAEGSPNWQRALESSESSTSTMTDVSSNDPDGLSNISANVLGTLVGSYVAMKEAGIYTPSRGQEVAGSIAKDLRANISYRLFNESDIKSDADVSLSRMLSYRGDLRVALEPLLKNSGYELEVFAYYLDTKDMNYLEELRRDAQNYRTATQNAMNVLVPEDALQHHLAILNALSEFEAVLEKMTSNADDPYATAALLRTFGDAEANVLFSFDALAGYFRNYTRS